MHVTRSKMTARLSFFTVLLVLASSCNRQETSTTDLVAAGIERTVKEVAIADGEPVTFADLSIEGMSCEMMCGGSIKKALARLPGIASAEIKFVEGDERDHAIVTYDDSKVNDAEMIEAIQKLHDGQYKVLAVEITRQVPVAETTHSSVKVKDQKGVNISAPSITALPSILGLLTQILRL